MNLYGAEEFAYSGDYSYHDDHDHCAECANCLDAPEVVQEKTVAPEWCSPITEKLCGRCHDSYVAYELGNGSREVVRK